MTLGWWDDLNLHQSARAYLSISSSFQGLDLWCSSYVCTGCSRPSQLPFFMNRWDVFYCVVFSNPFFFLRRRSERKLFGLRHLWDSMSCSSSQRKRRKEKKGCWLLHIGFWRSESLLHLHPAARSLHQPTRLFLKEEKNYSARERETGGGWKLNWIWGKGFFRSLSPLCLQI